MRMFKRVAVLAVTLAAAVLTVACGGGGSAGTSVFDGGSSGGATGGGTSGGGTVVTTPSLTLALSGTTVTAAAPVTATATVKSAAGVGVEGRVVSFTATGGLGTFSVASALTNAAGVATVALYPASNTTVGADTVVATTDVDGATLTASQGFQLTATNVTISSFTSDLNPNATTPAAQLSAYGQTTLRLAVAGAAAGSPVSISLVSSCVTAGKATLTPAGNATTTTGVATFTYKDGGCGAIAVSDALQATVVGTTSSAALNLPLSSPAVSSITFTSAVPETIYLKGSGFTETSTLTFKVVDLAGNPLPARNVLLEATTLAGGLTFDGGQDSTTLLSDANGVVTTRINSGTVPTPVRIKATIVGTNITTVSSNLSIAVGLPSQLNFSLSQATRNIEGGTIDGTPNTYNIIASDRLGNPVPAGTAINFVTEGGQIEAAKQIQITGGLGRVSAGFVSAEPRPLDGRVTILAYALGEESFIDGNGNNVYDRTPTAESFQDLGDVFLSRGFSSEFAVADQFISLSITAGSECVTYPNAVFPQTLLTRDATIPSKTSTCDGVQGRAYVRRAIETVLSTSTARPLWPVGYRPQVLNSGSCPRTIQLADSADLAATSGYAVFGDLGPYVVDSGVGTINLLAADNNSVRLNPVAAGTVVTVRATTGLTVSVGGGSPVPSVLNASGVSINYDFDGGVNSAVMTVTFTSPSGVQTASAVTLQRYVAGTAAVPAIPASGTTPAVPAVPAVPETPRFPCPLP
ncbi:hypothetical protein BH09PSE5_BH09PSE5_29290 [soil metagenome]